MHSRTARPVSVAQAVSCLLLVLLLLVSALVASPARAESRTPAAAPKEERTGRVLVRFRTDLSDAAVAAATGDPRSSVEEEIGALRIKAVSARAGGVEELVSRLRRNPNVVYAEAETVRRVSVTPNDPYYPRQWGHTATRAPQAWGISKGSTAVRIGIVDTGIDLNHPDLRYRYAAGYDFLRGDGSPNDEVGHGTHVAGIAAATGNNGLGITGTGWYSKLLIAKALGPSGGTDATVSKAIIWSANNGAAVINLSLGGYSYSRTLADAVAYAQRKGALIVAAAGNDGTDIPSYPAALPGVVAVAATNIQDQKAPFSNFGSYIDISAPGVGIYSTMPTYSVQMTSTYGYSRNYDYADGTSMASPFVAGAAAVIKAKYPWLTASQIWTELRAGADDVVYSGWDKYTGYGRLNLYRSLTYGRAYGVVKDAKTGKVVSGARVRLSGSTKSVLTDSLGRYSIGGIPTGGRTLVYSKAGYQSVSKSVTIATNGNHQVNASIRPLARLTGYVRNSSGGAISGATVRVGSTSVATRTDTYGRYVLSNVPLGSIRVTASRSGYYSRSASISTAMGTTYQLSFTLQRQ